MKIQIQHSAVIATKQPEKVDKLPFWQRDIVVFGGFSYAEKKNMYEVLSILLQAGLIISDALEMIEDQMKNGKNKAIIAQVNQDLQQGNSLFESMQKHSVFSHFEIYSVKAGESSSTLPEVFDELTKYYEQRIKLQKKLVQVLSYPVLVVVVAISVFYFMVSQVVPMFENIFKQFDAELPPLTLFMLSLSAWVNSYWWAILIGIIGIVGIVILAVRNPSIVRFFQYLLLKIPYIGDVMNKVYLSRFCISLSLLLKSKIKLDEALLLVHDSIGFYPLKEPLHDIRNRLIEGENLFEVIKSYPIFPPIFKQMMKVGDKTATTDKMFEKLAKNFESETDMKITVLTSFIEPLLVVFVGGIVALILLSMYIPMFKLSESIAF